MVRKVEPGMLADLAAIDFHVARMRQRLSAEDSLAPLEAAQRLVAARRARDACFADGLFGDPAWDLLLAAFIAGEEGAPMTRRGLIEAAGLPYTTATRWVERLEAPGLLAGRPAPGRKRSRHYRLTGPGADAMRRALPRAG